MLFSKYGNFAFPTATEVLVAPSEIMVNAVAVATIEPRVYTARPGKFEYIRQTI